MDEKQRKENTPTNKPIFVKTILEEWVKSNEENKIKVIIPVASTTVVLARFTFSICDTNQYRW